jgi:HK97 family phage prohead protease
VKTEAIFELDFVLDGKAVVSDIDDGIYVEGYASEFGLDRQDEIFEPGAFTDSMKAFMDSNPVLLFHHKFDQALGKVIEWSLDKKGMWIKAHLDQPEPNTFLADVFKKVKSGTIKGFSVGGKFHRRQSAGGVTRIHKADIMEISLTPLPVNSTALATVCQKAFDEPEDAKALEDRLDAVETELNELVERYAAAQR